MLLPSYLAILTFLVSVPPSTGLSCYSCSGSMPFSKCESDRKEFQRGLDSKYAVNCTEYSNMKTPYCAIESYMRNGQVQAIIRDCNDKTFSFSMANAPFKKINKVNAHYNVSVCTYNANKNQMVCVSMCDKDMCNGLFNASGQITLAVFVFVVLLVSSLINTVSPFI